MSKLQNLLEDRLIKLRANQDKSDDFFFRAFQDEIKQYMNNGHFHKIVQLALSQCDTGSKEQEETILLLCEDLERAGQTEEVIRLWRGFAAHSQRGYWIDLRHSKRGDILTYPLVPKSEIIEGQTYYMADFQKIAAQLGGAENAARLAVEETQNRALNCMQFLHDLLVAADYEDKAKQVEDEIAAVKTGQKRRVHKDSRKMDPDVFWEFIAKCQSADTAEEKVDRLSETLAKFNGTAIKTFARLLDCYMDELHHWDVWAIAFIARGGCSDDAFDYFKAWVIMQGRQVFESAVAAPLSLVEHLKSGEDPQCEGLISAPEFAYEDQTSRTLPRSQRKAAQIKGKEWKENELLLRYPTVFAALKR
jgi:hypothetical protein